jgi:hypothetical protein
MPAVVVVTSSQAKGPGPFPGALPAPFITAYPRLARTRARPPNPPSQTRSAPSPQSTFNCTIPAPFLHHFLNRISVSSTLKSPSQSPPSLRCSFHEIQPVCSVAQDSAALVTPSNVFERFLIPQQLRQSWSRLAKAKNIFRGSSGFLRLQSSQALPSAHQPIFGEICRVFPRNEKRVFARFAEKSGGRILAKSREFSPNLAFFPKKQINRTCTKHHPSKSE